MANSHKAFMISQTALVVEGIQGALDYLEAPEWLQNADAVSAGELLTEIAGRLCYRSFRPGLNPNVTKVREGNKPYLENVLKQHHGSVLEHGYVGFALLNVSRIFTHELVRHRAGVGYSQESQRFVRLDDFQMYIPDLTPALEELAQKTIEIPSAGIPDENARDQWVQDMQAEFVLAMDQVKELTQDKMKHLLDKFGLDAPDVPFHVKKALTSAFRRMLPGGVNTHIIVTANHRAWRHIIEMRTSPGAEVEIVEIIGDVARQLLQKFPHLYQDAVQDGPNNYHFLNSKV